MVELPKARVNPAWHIGALFLYGVISVVVVDHGLPISKVILGYTTDPSIFIWFLAWWPWAIAHHANLLFTDLLWQPLGVPLFWVTSISLLSVVSLPVTLLSSPVVSYNLLILAAPVLSAWMAYWLCIYLRRDPIASLIGGFLFGFSSYEMAQTLATLNLSFTVFVPALLLIILLRLDDRISRAQAVFLAAIALVAQFLISIEVFTLIFVFGGISWLLALLYMPARRPVLKRLFWDGLAAGLVVLLLLSPALVSMIMHFNYLHVPSIWPYFFDADIANVFVPTMNTLGGGFFKTISHKFNSAVTMGYQEQDAYYGLPVLLIIYLFARRQGSTPWGRFLTVIFLFFLVASFGPHLWVDGHYTAVVLPWQFVMGIPLLNMALPARFALFVSLVAAIIVALWIASPGSRGWRIALGVLACAALLPRPHPSMPLPDSAFFKPGRVQGVLGENPRILILPFAINGPSSYWQAENGFGFTQTGGYLGFPPAAMQHFSAVGELFGNFMGPEFLKDFMEFCTATKTQYVVIGPGTKPEMEAALKTLDWKTQKIDDVTVLTVPES